MLIYIDLLFILNFWIDFLLLITTNLILKYEVFIKRTIFSSLIGALSTFLIIINNNIVLFFFKIIICIVMQLIMNRYKGFKTLIENVLYFYLTSIILAGGLYLLKIDELSMKYNFILLIIVTPIILLLNKNQIKKLDTYYKELYNVELYYKDKKYIFNAMVDTGNNLYDQYKKRPISIIYSKKIKFDYKNGILVPMQTANKKSLLKCIKVDKLIINNKEYKNVLIGLSNVKFKIQDINMILHKDMIGGLR